MSFDMVVRLASSADMSSVEWESRLNPVNKSMNYILKLEKVPFLLCSGFKAL